MGKLTERLDRIAEKLESSGHAEEALAVDKLSDELDTTMETDPVIRRGVIQPIPTEQAVTIKIEAMKGLSNLLFAMGVDPATWARVPNVAKAEISDILIPEDKTSGAVTNYLASLKGLREKPNVITRQSMTEAAERMAKALSGYPALGKEIRKKAVEFVANPESISKALLSALRFDKELQSELRDPTKDPEKADIARRRLHQGIGAHRAVKLHPPGVKVMQEKLAAEELIASDVVLIETALQEVEAADREIEAAWATIEAARKRKRKWIKGIKLRKGRLTSYKKPGESMSDAANRALRSDDPSVRSMGSFYMATRKFKKRKRGSPK